MADDKTEQTAEARSDDAMQKKRAAARQLRKDDDSDDEGDETQAGEFRRADQATLAQRKIVKVARRGAPAASAPAEEAPRPAATPLFNFNADKAPTAAPVFNFGTTSTLAPVAHAAAAASEAAAPAESKVAAAAAEKSEEKKEDTEAGDKPKQNGEAASASAPPASSEEAAKDTSIFKSYANPSSTLFSFSSASTQSPFTFQTSFAFNFGSSASAGATSSSPGASGFSAPAFSFGGAAPGAAGGSGSDDEGAAAPFAVAIEAKPLPPPPPVQTGEEDEIHVFQARGKLFVFDSANKAQPWKERGIGPLRVNVAKDKSSARLLMRVEGTGHLILNQSLFAAFKVEKAGDKAVRFVGTALEGPELCTYLVKFGRPDNEKIDDLIRAVDEHKPKAAGDGAKSPAKPADAKPSSIKLRRQGTMEATAAEGQRFLDEAEARERKAQQTEEDSEDNEGAAKLTRQNTMTVTAAEGERFLKEQEERDKKKADKS